MSTVCFCSDYAGKIVFLCVHYLGFSLIAYKRTNLIIYLYDRTFYSSDRFLDDSLYITVQIKHCVRTEFTYPLMQVYFIDENTAL